MTGTNVISEEDQIVDTDIFIIIENEKDYYDFVTIDENASYDAVVIDMSHDDFSDAIIVNFDDDSSSDSFVSIDEDQDQIFTSDFTADDLLINLEFK